MYDILLKSLDILIRLFGCAACGILVVLTIWLAIKAVGETSRDRDSAPITKSDVAGEKQRPPRHYKD
jgi:hypothetical protein